MGLLFLVHLANVVDVYWIAGRTDSLSTLFSLVCVLGFVKFLYTGGRAWLLISGVGLVGGLLSKETAAILASILLALAVLLCALDRRSPPGTPKEPRLDSTDPSPGLAPSVCKTGQILPVLSPFFLVTAGYVIYLYLRFYRPNEAGLPAMSPRAAIETLLKSLALLAFPVRPALVARVYEANSWLLVLGGGAVVVGAMIAAIWMWRRGRGNLALFMGLSILFLIPLLPTLRLGGISSRLMYLPIAILCVALAVWAWARPGAGRWIIYAIYPVVVIMALVSWQQGTLWVQNWDLTQAYCHSFRGIMTAKALDRDLIFLTTPYSNHDVPVYANDLNGALFHCLNGQFGTFSRLEWMGPLIVEGHQDARAIITLGRPEPGSFDLSLASPITHFLFPPGAQPGSRYNSSLAHLVVNAVNEQGLVTGFTVTFLEPERLDQRVLIYATNAAFYTIPHDIPPAVP